MRLQHTPTPRLQVDEHPRTSALQLFVGALLSEPSFWFEMRFLWGHSGTIFIFVYVDIDCASLTLGLVHLLLSGTGVHVLLTQVNEHGFGGR